MAKKCVDQATGYKSTCLMIIICDITIVILCGFTGRYMDLERELNEAGESGSDKPFCLPCLELQKHPDDGLHHGIQRYNSKCCAKNESFVHTLVYEYVTSWHGKKLHEENPQFSRCRERIMPTDKPLIKLSISEKQTGKYTDVEWDDVLRRTDHLKYKDGFVSVEKPGLYFIYSKVSFTFKKNITIFPELPRQHQIVVKRYSSTADFDELVARGTTSNCVYEGIDKGDSHNSTSFIGTVYRLRKDDKVAVKVHDRKQLLETEDQFFGLHMI